MPPKKPATSSSKATPAKAKRGTKRSAAPAEPDAQPNAKRVATSTRSSSRTFASTSTSTITTPRTSVRSNSTSIKARTQRRAGAPAFVAKRGMNALPTPLHPTGSSKHSLFIFGAGEMNQRGLGPDMIDEITHPTLHAWVEAKNQVEELGPKGLEMVVAGGMHTLAIDGTGRILSWGVNDDGALGRQTKRGMTFPKADARYVHADDLESQPMQVEGLSPTGKGPQPGKLPNGGKVGDVEKFRATRVAAGDSICVALNEMGEVRAWGSFRSNHGLLAFDAQGITRRQVQPIALRELANHSFVQVACGNNHVLALASDGSVFTWGVGQQMQLGRRVTDRHPLSGLTPKPLPLGNFLYVAAGAFHSFAIDAEGQVWGWGLNTSGQLGTEVIGEDETVLNPVIIDALSPSVLSDKGDVRVTAIAAGDKHSIFLLSNGKIMGTGRCHDGELGLADSHPLKQRFAQERQAWQAQRELELPDELREWNIDCFRDMLRWDKEENLLFIPQLPLGFAPTPPFPKPTMGPEPEQCIREPVGIPLGSGESEDATHIVGIDCGATHNLAVARDGTAYSWGSGGTSQLGQGTAVLIKVPTVLRSSALTGCSTVAVTGGGQHSALLAYKRAE